MTVSKPFSALIRKARPNDFNLLQALDIEASYDTQWWVPSSTKELKDLIQNEIVLIAFVGKQPIGFISGQHEFKNFFRFNDVFVLKKFRKRGIARDLIQSFLSEVKKQKKYSSIRLICSKKLQKYYQKFGFEKRDTVLMDKKLR